MRVHKLPFGVARGRRGRACLSRRGRPGGFGGGGLTWETESTLELRRRAWRSAFGPPAGAVDADLERFGRALSRPVARLTGATLRLALGLRTRAESFFGALDNGGSLLAAPHGRSQGWAAGAFGRSVVERAAGGGCHRLRQCFRARQGSQPRSRQGPPSGGTWDVSGDRGVCGSSVHRTVRGRLSELRFCGVAGRVRVERLLTAFVCVNGARAPSAVRGAVGRAERWCRWFLLERERRRSDGAPSACRPWPTGPLNWCERLTVACCGRWVTAGRVEERWTQRSAAR